MIVIRLPCNVGDLSPVFGHSEPIIALLYVNEIKKLKLFDAGVRRLPD